MLDIYKKRAEYPGDMAFAHERGHFPGVAVMHLMWCLPGDTTVTVDARLNEWAKANPMFIVIEVLTTSSGVLVFYTRQVTAEEEADLNEVAREVDALMQKRRAERAEAAAKAQEAKDNEERETARLAELGKRCEQNHAKTEKEKADVIKLDLAKPKRGK